MSKNLEFLTDAEVEAEIIRLRNSDAVKIAKKEQQIKYARRQLLYNYRSLAKRGQKLLDQGYTVDNIADMMADEDYGD